MIKKYANRNLPFVFNKRKFDNKAEIIHFQTGVIYNDYDVFQIHGVAACTPEISFFIGDANRSPI